MSVPDPVFQEWKEDRRLRKLESELEIAGDEERDELSNLERSEEVGRLMESIEDYAKTGIEEALGEPYSPGSSMASLPPPEIITVDHKENKLQETPQQQQRRRKNESTAKASVQPPKEKKRKPIFELTRLHKILIRNSVVLVISLIFPYFEVIRSLAEGTSLFIPIYCLILALRPLNDTCIGVEIQQTLSYIVLWPFLVAYSIFMFAVTGTNLAGYMILFAIGILLTFMIGLKYPTSMLSILLQAITFSVQHISIWKVNNLEVVDEPFHRSLLILGGATFGTTIPYMLHCLGALVIFPWTSIASTQQILNNRFTGYGILLRRLRPVYAQVAAQTLDPTQDSGQVNISPVLLKKLVDARKAEINSIVLAQKWLGQTLLETRFLCNGDGLRYLERYDASLTITRIARSAASDMLNYFDECSAKGSDLTYTDSLRKKATFLEQEVQAMIQMDQSEIERRQTERRRIPIIINEINLLLELGAHRFALLSSLPPSARDSHIEREKAIMMLDREQQVLDRLARELEDLMITWMERYLRSTAAKTMESARMNKEAIFHRTTLTSYVLVLLKLVKTQKELGVQFKSETMGQHEDWKREWSITFPFQDMFLTSYYASERKAFYVKTPYWSTRVEERCLNFFSSMIWKMGLKFSLGTTLLVLPGLLPDSYSLFSSVQLLNAVFAFQVILFKTQTGLVIERTAHRLIGVTLGYIFAGVIWELACIGGCTADNHEWIFYGAEVFALAIYLYVKTVLPQFGYVVFAALRTLVSLSVVFLQATEPTQVDVWVEGGYILASTLMGAAGALVLALFVWPTTGRALIRETLSQSYHDFNILFEHVLTERYEQPLMLDRVLPQVAAFEHGIAYSLFVNISPQLRSADLESKQRLNFDVPHEHYVKAVESTQRVWHSLWKLHHLGGICIFMSDEKGHMTSNMRPETARSFYTAHRWLTSAFSSAAARLGSKQRESMPVLRPIAATPHLLREVLQDFLTLAFRDEEFFNSLLASKNLAVMSNMLFLADCFQDISYALNDVYTFMEYFLHKPIYAQRLRDAEQASFDRYAASPEIVVA